MFSSLVSTLQTYTVNILPLMREEYLILNLVAKSAVFSVNCAFQNAPDFDSDVFDR